MGDRQLVCRSASSSDASHALDGHPSDSAEKETVSVSGCSQVGGDIVPRHRNTRIQTVHSGKW